MFALLSRIIGVVLAPERLLSKTLSRVLLNFDKVNRFNKGGIAEFLGSTKSKIGLTKLWSRVNGWATELNIKLAAINEKTISLLSKKLGSKIDKALMDSLLGFEYSTQRIAFGKDYAMKFRKALKDRAPWLFHASKIVNRVSFHKIITGSFKNSFKTSSQRDASKKLEKKFIKKSREKGNLYSTLPRSPNSWIESMDFNRKTKISEFLPKRGRTFFAFNNLTIFRRIARSLSPGKVLWDTLWLYKRKDFNKLKKKSKKDIIDITMFNKMHSARRRLDK